MPHDPPRLGCAVLALSVCALLAACDRGGVRTVGQQPDTTIATTGRSPEVLTSDAREAAREVGQVLGRVADSAINTTQDVAITAEVNTRLARDGALGALRIDVDTSGGHVVLRGSAPDTDARARAAELARSVDGVVSVHNDLIVQPPLR